MFDCLIVIPLVSLSQLEPYIQIIIACAIVAMKTPSPNATVVRTAGETAFPRVRAGNLIGTWVRAFVVVMMSGAVLALGVAVGHETAFSWDCKNLGLGLQPCHPGIANAFG